MNFHNIIIGIDAFNLQSAATIIIVYLGRYQMLLACIKCVLTCTELLGFIIVIIVIIVQTKFITRRD